MRQFPVGTAKRWEVVADQLGTGRTADAVATFAKQHAAKAASLAGDDFASFLASRKGSADVASEGGISTRETAFTDVQLQASDADSWSEAQDMALVAPMKAHPKGSDDKARWVAIAAEVGKSPSVCVKRVQALKEKVKKGDS